MKCFYFVVKRYHHRDDSVIGMTLGVVQSESAEKAEEIVVQKHVDDHAVLDILEEFDMEEGMAYTAYRSSMQ